VAPVAAAALVADGAGVGVLSLLLLPQAMARETAATPANRSVAKRRDFFRFIFLPWMLCGFARTFAA
jgi:hypothetical protein